MGCGSSCRARGRSACAGRVAAWCCLYVVLAEFAVVVLRYALGLGSIRILTNNPKKIKGLEGYGLSVSAQIPIEHAPNEHNEAYLRTKADKARKNK